MELLIASDHAGFEGKEALKGLLREHALTDLGTDGPARTDYPVLAGKLVREVLRTGRPGVLLCGTGIGMSMAANRHRGIRAALASSEEDARLAREHNDANVLCMGARKLRPGAMAAMVRAWLAASFLGGRHLARTAMLDGPGGAA